MHLLQFLQLFPKLQYFFCLIRLTTKTIEQEIATAARKIQIELRAPTISIRRYILNEIKARTYATANWITIEIQVHFLPISFLKTEIVAKHGEYKRQKTINDSALAGVKQTAAEGSIIERIV